MYPAIYFSLFPAFPRDHRAFVAMSFDRRFESRWEQVLGPAIRNVEFDGRPLQPHRVDFTAAGDSVLTEILEYIARCRLVVADISALDQLNGRALRNQNVFYEVGLAHAVRLPEEVLLFRSDNYELAFDISNVRVHEYNPDSDPVGARRIVSEKIVGSMRELDLRRHMALRRAAERLDADSWLLLAEAQPPNQITPPKLRTMGEVLSGAARLNAIARLLDLGAIRSDFLRVTEDLLDTPGEPEPELITYCVTPFGSALFDYIVTEMGLTSPDIRPRLERLLTEKP